MNLLPVSLALCDGFAAKKFVSTSGRTASTLIQLPDFSTFEKNATKNEFDLLRRLESLYEETVEAGYKFFPDEFGGHSLKTLRNRQANQVLTAPAGIMAKIKPADEHNFDDLSTIAPTQMCKYPRLVAGSIRFVNSSCNPNCKYEFTSLNGLPCFKLKTLKAIEAADEITVYYGKEFFESLECRCPHVHLHEPPLSTVCSQSFSVCRSFESAKVKRRRITLSGFMSFVCAETSKSYKRKRTVLMDNSTGEIEDLRASPSQDSSDFSCEESRPEERLLELEPVGSSNPIHNGDPREVFSAENIEEVHQLSRSDSQCSTLDIPLTAHPEIGLNNLQLCLTALCSKHRASDALMNDVLKVFRSTNPGRNLPGMNHFKNESRK